MSKKTTEAETVETETVETTTAGKTPCIIALQVNGTTGGKVIETVKANLSAVTVSAAMQDSGIAAKVGKGLHVEIIAVTAE